MQSLNLQPPALESYSDIVLTEEEKQEALRLMRQQKHFEIKSAEYRKKLWEEPVVPQYDAKQLMGYFSDHFTVDEENRQVVEQVCRYFAGDSSFSGNLERGLCLYGTVGVGKTSLMEFFMRNQRQTYVMVSCRQVEAAYATKGDEGLNKYFGLRAYCFDDLGTEPPVTKYYGTDKAAMTEVLLNRYDLHLPKNCTHLTTNLSGDEIRNRYGSRVADRMREMFNFIEFKTTKSRRL